MGGHGLGRWELGWFKGEGTGEALFLGRRKRLKVLVYVLFNRGREKEALSYFILFYYLQKKEALGFIFNFFLLFVIIPFYEINQFLSCNPCSRFS